MSSKKLVAIRARWAVPNLSLNPSQVRQGQQDVQDLLSIAEQAVQLLDALYDREQSMSSPSDPLQRVGRDVWVGDMATAASALEEIRATLGGSLGWNPPK